MPQFIIFPHFIRNQFLMAALLDDGSFVEHRNLIAEFTGGEAVADVDSRLIACDVVKFRVDFHLCHRV